MFRFFIKPLPFIITFATVFGVLMHDTQLDRAATVAMAMPIGLATYAAVDKAIKSGDSHIHVEKVAAPHHVNAMRAFTPRLQPRDDDRKYQLSKKIFLGAGDAPSLWPSV